PRMDQRLLAASARFGSPALADPCVSTNRGDFAYLFHDFARDRKSPGASPAVHRQTIREGELGFASHGRERIGRARVRHLSPAPFHRSQIRSAIPAPQTRSAPSLRRLFDDGLRIPKRLRVELLHRGFIPSHAPSHSRVIELLSIAGPE